MKTFFFLLFVILINSVFANEGRIVVLNSLKNEKKFFYGLTDVFVEKKFKKAFSGQDILFRHQATQDDIYEALTNPKNDYIFWIGHGAKEIKINQNISISPSFKDIDGREIKDLFSVYSKNLRGLFIISCESTFLEKMIKDRNLHIKTFDHKIFLGSGIRLAIKDAKAQMQTNTSNREEKNEESIAINISINPSRGKNHSLQVFINSHFLALLPAVDETTKFTIKINKKLFKEKKNTLFLKSGLNGVMAEKIEMGDIMIDSDSYDAEKTELKGQDNINGSIIFKLRPKQTILIH
ncbi:MAG: hypothetical protein AB7I27_14230 [Bacteriovoracaceae bacterium]